MAVFLPRIDLMRVVEQSCMVNRMIVVGEVVDLRLADTPSFIVQFYSVRRHPLVPFGLYLAEAFAASPTSTMVLKYIKCRGTV